MPEQLKKHGEVLLKDAPARVEDTVVAEFGGARIYARQHPPGLPPTLNGSHKERRPIEEIAKRLHAQGYAVKIEKFDANGAKIHDFEAVWAGPGDPPPPPFH